MPKLFMSGIILFLLLGAGYGMVQAAQSGRYIPWDCSDWQAFAHEDRDTAILESLAENRGKTLYCGIDQSDTFAKAETWAAGKDRNERDDTVYYGERGRFRGFIAAQEGWLTEGESGITGQSIAHIFEFPREQRERRRKKKEYLRNAVGAPPWNYSWYYGPEASSTTSQTQANTDAQTAFNANLPTQEEMIRYVRLSTEDFKAQLSSDAERARYVNADTTYYHGGVSSTHDGLDAFCKSLGYQRAVNVIPVMLSTFSNVYETRSVTVASVTTWYSSARRGINYSSARNGDCFRRR